MKKPLFLPAALLTCTFAVVIFSSCSRQITGYGYQSRVDAPDITASNIEPVSIAPAHSNNEMTGTDPAKNQDAIQSFDQVLVSAEKQEKLNELTQLATNEMNKLEVQNREMGLTEPVSSKQLVRNVANQMVAKGMVKDISEKKMKKLEKLAMKWEKKKQLHRDNFLGSGNMLLFAVIALAGLVVGIFVHWIGWIIFAVFGAIWLYKKLDGQ